MNRNSKIQAGTRNNSFQHNFEPDFILLLNRHNRSHIGTRLYGIQAVVTNSHLIICETPNPLSGIHSNIWQAQITEINSSAYCIVAIQNH